MRNMWTALLIKYVGNLAALFFGMTLSETPPTTGQVLGLGALLTVLAYYTGDRIILPAAGNLTAVGADIGLAAVTLWVASLVWPALDLGALTIVVTALLVGLVEFFFHGYLKSQGLVEVKAEQGDRNRDGR